MEKEIKMKREIIINIIKKQKENVNEIQKMILDNWETFKKLETNNPDKLTQFYNHNLDIIFNTCCLSILEINYLCTFNKEWYNYYIDLYKIDTEKFDIKREMMF